MNWWKFFTREPDLIIGPVDDPYMHRWMLFPKNRWFNIYLHKIIRSDNDFALHDHPYNNISVVLKGGYDELVPEKSSTTLLARIFRDSEGFQLSSYVAHHFQPPFRQTWRPAGSVIFRQAAAAHRLVLPLVLSNTDTTPRYATAWSLFIVGRRRREWGFWLKDRWVPHTEFADEVDGVSTYKQQEAP